jgi:hypothetical protein
MMSLDNAAKCVAFVPLKQPIITIAGWSAYYKEKKQSKKTD